MDIKDTKELIKLFKDKASKYVEVNRKRKNDPNHSLDICREFEDTFESNPIEFRISKSNFKFSIEIWSYDKKEDLVDDDSVLFTNDLVYNPSEDFSSSITTKELIEIMCYDIEDTITNKRGKRINIKSK